MNKHTYHGVRRYIWRHIIRASVKSSLVIVVTFAIFLTQGWLQEAISRNELEINRLYETTHVFGQIVSSSDIMPLNREGGDVIRRQTVDEIVAGGLVIDVYFETMTPWALVTNPDVDDERLNEILDEVAGDDNDFEAWQHREELNELIAIPQLDLFIARHAFESATQVPGVDLIGRDLEIEFAAGFDQVSFTYTDENLEMPIPVILSEETLMMNGFELGDMVTIGYDLDRDPIFRQQIMGEVMGVHRGTDMIQAVFLPLSAWEFAQGDSLGFSTLEFMVDPMLNRELSAVQESIEEILIQPGAGFASLMLDLQDEELRFVVQTMEENVSLLWLLYPVIVAVSMMIVMGLSFFLTLQNAKNVSVMRIFGATLKRAGLMLWIEQIILSVSGLMLGLGFLIALDWGFGGLELLGIAGIYLFGIMVGSTVGIFTIMRHSPLELLQVKE